MYLVFFFFFILAWLPCFGFITIIYIVDFSYWLSPFCAYNPKGADRLGVVYTPNEIVHFMVESTDYLLDKHFKRLLADDHVEILDPATGTGTTS